MTSPKIYIVVPMLEYCSQKLEDFLHNHQFLMHNANIKLLLKTIEPIPINDDFIINVHQSDTSIYQAWNQSIAKLRSLEPSSNFFVIFCGIDDILMQDFFVKAEPKLSSNLDIVFGNIEIIIDRSIKFRKSNPNSSMLKNSKIKKWDIFHPGMFMNGRLFQDFAFDETFKLAADFKFFVELSNGTDLSCQYLDETQSLININGISNQPASKLTYIKELDKIAEDCGILIIGFNKYLEKFKMIILSSHFGSYIRRLYWTFK